MHNNSQMLAFAARPGVARFIFLAIPSKQLISLRYTRIIARQPPAGCKDLSPSSRSIAWRSTLDLDILALYWYLSSLRGQGGTMRPENRPENVRPVAQGLTGVQGAYIWGSGLYMAYI